jgi:hypothetical protein
MFRSLSDKLVDQFSCEFLFLLSLSGLLKCTVEVLELELLDAYDTIQLVLQYIYLALDLN